MFEKQLFPAPKGWKRITIWIFRNWFGSLAGLTAAVYILGFLVVNFHLSQYGIYDFEFGDAHYVYGGGMFAVYLLIYLCSSGRLVISLSGKMKLGILSYIISREDTRALKAFAYMRFADILAGIVFGSCVGAFLFSGIFLSTPLDSAFGGFAVTVILIDYLLISKHESRYPKICAMTGVIIKIIAICVFFYGIGDSKLGAIFWSYFLISCFFDIYSDIIEKKQGATSLKELMGIFTVFMTLIWAIYFGEAFYGEIPRSMGGGKPLYADVQIKEEFTSLFPDRKDPKHLFGVKIVHITDKHIFIEEDGEIIRIPDHSIMGIKTKPSKDDTDKEN